ncbi:MAG: leucine-rich repeat domain-containing protein [Paludibacteraceae bacterium]|nr:leucine-rich repeat domain-containing protein [Paludibacteraceae bacterium]
MIQNEKQLAIYYTESNPTLTMNDSVSGRFYTMSFFDGVLTIDATQTLSANDRENANAYGGRTIGTVDKLTNESYDDWQFIKANTEIVVMRGNITDIAAGVFSHFEKLHTIVLPNSLEEIGEDNFLWCPNLRYIHLSKYVKSVDGLTSKNNLLYIDVAEENTEFCSVNGYLMSKDQRELVAAPGGLEIVEIPDGCERIGEEALFNTHRKVIIPASVNEIDICNFYSGVLEEIVLGDYERQYPLVESCFKLQNTEAFQSINIH